MLLGHRSKVGVPAEVPEPELYNYEGVEHVENVNHREPVAPSVCLSSVLFPRLEHERLT